VPPSAEKGGVTWKFYAKNSAFEKEARNAEKKKERTAESEDVYFKKKGGREIVLTGAMQPPPQGQKTFNGHIRKGKRGELGIFLGKGKTHLPRKKKRPTNNSGWRGKELQQSIAGKENPLLWKKDRAWARRKKKKMSNPVVRERQ